MSLGYKKLKRSIIIFLKNKKGAVLDEFFFFF